MLLKAPEIELMRARRERAAMPCDTISSAKSDFGHRPNSKATHPSTGERVGHRKPALEICLEAFESIGRWADRNPRTALFLVQVLVLAAYAPAFFYKGFLMDDTVAIEKNPNVVSPTFSFSELMRRDYWGLPMHGASWTNKSFRPLTTFTFRLNYLLHGLLSSGFHAANVLFHCLTSIVIGRTAVQLAGLSGGAAAFCAALFGLHPVHTENVLYLVGRADILSALLGLQALNMYASRFCPPGWVGSYHPLTDRRPPPAWRELPAMLPTLGLIVASGLSKEIGFTLFAIPILLEILELMAGYFTSSPTRPLSSRALRVSGARVSVLFLSTFMVFLARYRHTGGTALNMSPQDNPISFESNPEARMLSYSFLHGVYTKLLLFPYFLCYDYSMDAIPILREKVDCRLLLPLAAYIIIVGSICVTLGASPRSRRAALLSLALLVVTFLPAANILFPVGTVIGERLLYVPSAGFCLVVAVFLNAANGGQRCRYAAARQQTTRPSKQRHAHSEHASLANGPHHGANGASHQTLDPSATSPMWLRWTVVAFVPVILVLFGVRTSLRVQDWRSPEALFIRDGHSQPHSSKVQHNLGITYMQNQDWDKAVEAFVRCAHADPLSSLPFYRIGQIEILRGNYVSAEAWLGAALDKFGASLMVRDEEVFHDLAVALFQNGKAEAAERRLQVALQLDPQFAKGWANLACCIASRDLRGAARAAQKAVSLSPENPQYWANLAVLSRHIGDQSTAQMAWQQAVAIYPAMPEPRDCSWEFAPGG